MRPQPVVPESEDLFHSRLAQQINMRHALVRLAELVDWAEIARTLNEPFTSSRCGPALAPRLIAGLLYLQHTFDASDEAVVNTWVENPYWEYFCGEVYLQTEAPIDRSSLTLWRKRIGEEGVETLLMATIEAALRGGVMKASSVDRVIVDTTVMPKAIAQPTDSRLLESRQYLVKVAEEHGLSLRQKYNRIGPRLATQVGRYAHAKQFKRMRRAVRTLRSRVGRVQRDVARQLGELPEQAQAKVSDLLARTNRILTQRTKDKNKLYALHAPEVECISKGKARTPYEFGAEVGIATTLKEGLVVGMRGMPGNPYDGHTLEETLEQVAIVVERKPVIAVVDDGYRGVEIGRVQILRLGQKRASPEHSKP